MWSSSRLVTIVLITGMTLACLITLTAIDKETGRAAVSPAFFALGALWTVLGGSKIAEHATKHLRKEDA